MSSSGKRIKRVVEPGDVNERFILNFHFTLFQKEAIKLIYEMRILSTSQVAIILSKNVQYVRRELLDLYKHGFLYRAFYTEEIGHGNNEAYWMLDRGGALFIAGAFEVSVKSLNWSIRDNLIKFDKLKHSIKISEIRTSLEIYAKKLDHKIEMALCDRHLFYEFKDADKKYKLSPDLFIVYNDGKRIYQYFFEVDMGTMTINGPLNRSSVVTSKVPKYELFRATGEWEKYFDVYPRIIFLTTNKNRANYMLDSIKEKQITNMDFLISTFEFFDSDAVGQIYKKSVSGEVTNIFI